MKQYLISIVAVCLIAVPAAALVGHTAMKRVVRLMGGLLLLLVVLRPLLHFDMAELVENLKSLDAEYRLDTEFLEDETQRQMSDYIKSATEAYIVREAEHMGVLVQAKVRLSSGSCPQPEHVRLIGAISADQLEALKKIISEDLDIAGEEVEWEPYATDD